MKIGLAASGGGHLRQILDLEPFWSAHDHFFVTDAGGIADDLAKSHRLYRIDHFAVGQARMGKGLSLIKGAFFNFFQSIPVVLRERPDLIVTTGAGAMFWTILFARLLGAKIVLIDSFARFEHPSKFARLARPLAHHVVVQSAALKSHWPDAHFFDPFRILDKPRPPKEPLLLATVGAILSFDRMSEAVVELKRNGMIAENIVLQTGEKSSVPPGEDKALGLRCVEKLSFEEMQALLAKADIVLCHGGTGSIITALRQGCRVIAMPRLVSRGEGYDDHQFEIANAFAKRGLVEVVVETSELPAAIERVRQKEPVSATTEPTALLEWLSGYAKVLAQSDVPTI